MKISRFKFAKKLLGFLVKNKKQGIIDHRDKINDPRELFYVNNLPKYLINLSINNGRGWRWFTLNEPTYHPFIYGLKKYLDNNQSYSVLKDIIDTYSSSVRLKNANEALGINNVFPEKSSPFAFVFPWNTGTPEFYQEKNYQSRLKENLLYGLNSDAFLGDMVSTPEKVEIEVNRLISLYQSISEKGYIQNNSKSIYANLMCYNDQYVWSVAGGQHRAAILAALGYTKIPVVVKKIIRREDVDIWPAVKSGIYDRETALSIFDRYFYAKPPPVFDKWIKAVDNGVV